MTLRRKLGVVAVFLSALALGEVDGHARGRTSGLAEGARRCPPVLEVEITACPPAPGTWRQLGENVACRELALRPRNGRPRWQLDCRAPNSMWRADGCVMELAQNLPPPRATDPVDVSVSDHP